ncbi:hypothetical protein L208DRAFT_1379444 [Tricholoma matsutake]|nr:hypothetical protein L208DRAFT_1379444 [Tricholoma matsutake 945]
MPGQANLLWPPVLGQKSVRWDQVFALVKQLELLWDCWQPSKSLDQFDLQELWTCYSLGEPIFNDVQVQTGIKPPLQLVEQYFQSKWCGRSSGDGKRWEHVHEIPEWILSQSTARVVSLTVIIEGLKEMRCGSGNKTKKGLNALVKEVKQLRFAHAQERTSDSDPSFEPPLLPSASLMSSLVSASSSSMALSCPSAPATFCAEVIGITVSGSEKKWRALPVDARRKKKKAA